MKSHIETDNKGFPSGHTINEYSPCYVAKFVFDPPFELKKNSKYIINSLSTRQPFYPWENSFCEAVSVRVFGSKIKLFKIDIIDNEDKVVAIGKLNSFRRIFFDAEIKKWRYVALWNLTQQIYGLN